MQFKLPSDPALAAELERRIEALSDEAMTEFFLEFEKWEELPPFRRMGAVVAILNDRYDVCVLSPAGGCPNIVGAFDPLEESFTLSKLTTVDAVEPRHAVRVCARALGEPVWSQTFFG